MLETKIALQEMPGLQVVATLAPDAIAAFGEWAEAVIALNEPQDLPSSGKTQIWFGKQPTLSGKTQFIDRALDERVLRLGERLLAGWNSALLVKYQPGVGLKAQTDAGCFSGHAVAVSVGQSTAWTIEEGRYRRIAEVGSGLAIRYSPRQTHGIEASHTIRYTLTFWLLKAEFLTPSLLTLSA